MDARKEKVIALIASQKIVGFSEALNNLGETDPVVEALAPYLMRKYEYLHPIGHWAKQVWWPNPSEVEACCKKIKGGGFRSWGSFRKHCLTAVHVAHRYGADPEEFSKFAKLYIRIAGQDFILDGLDIKAWWRDRQSYKKRAAAAAVKARAKESNKQAVRLSELLNAGAAILTVLGK